MVFALRRDNRAYADWPRCQVTCESCGVWGREALVCRRDWVRQVGWSMPGVCGAGVCGYGAGAGENIASRSGNASGSAEWHEDISAN